MIPAHTVEPVIDLGSKPSKREGRAVVKFLKRWFYVWLCLAVLGCQRTGHPPIRVGVLHSLTGPLAGGERNVADATLMAIEELNRNGGLLGRKIEARLVDGRSDPQAFLSGAEELIDNFEAQVIFGCWSSACRKELLPLLERRQSLLFYPLQYEGLEKSPYVVYTGAAPNQQLLPAVKWSFDHLGPRFFLVGSDYVYPRTANEIARIQIEALGGEVVGEEYVSRDRFEQVAATVAKARPDVILNTVNGDANVELFQELRRAGVSSKAIPTMSLSLTEGQLQAIEPDLVEGDYATWSYFQSVDTPENREFVERFKHRYGSNRVTDAPTEAAYIGVHLWAQAVTRARTANPEEVRRSVVGQAFAAPQGVVCVDSSRHTWKNVRVGQVGADRQFSTVWDSEWPVRPIPYPFFRSHQDWNRFLDELRSGWEGRWENPNNG